MLSFTFQYASVGRRVAALAIDVALLMLVAALLFEPVLEVLGLRAASEALHRVPFSVDIVRAYGAELVLLILAAWLYFSKMESSRFQATVGKRIMGLMVFTRDESRLTFRQASRRFWAKVLSVMTCFFGFFLAIGDVKHRALHDRIAASVVL